MHIVVSITYCVVIFFRLCTQPVSMLPVSLAVSLDCVPNVAGFFGLCTQCFFRLVYPMLPVSSSCVLYVAGFFVLCTLCCRFLRLVYPMLPVSSSCVPYVAGFFGLSFFDLSLRYSLTFIFSVL